MLLSDIQSNLKLAQKAGEVNTVSTLRMLISAIKNAEIAKQQELTDDEVVTVIRKQIKQRNESIEAYAKYGRNDLEAIERAELAILSKYIPSEMGREQIVAVINQERGALPEADRTNMGLVMKAVMAKIGSQAEPGIVAGCVKEVIATG